ncbi:Zn-dependent hydrolase [Acidobacteriota bacterium]
MEIRINLDRLKKDLEDLSQIGRDSNNGISRPSFSKADLEARIWLEERIKSAGLEFRQDGAGNMFGRIEGEGKTVMAGSHIDTVMNGGMFDGSLGVLSALECLRRIKEEGLRFTKALEMASFTDEEGNLVGDFLGSRAFVNSLDKEMLELGVTQFGIPFKEILNKTKFTIDSIMEAHKNRPGIEAYLEIHIEQGPILETEDKPIGIVDAIAGKIYRLCSFQGQASHAGTTPFELRQDAFLGLADFALRGTHHVAAKHYGSMMTIGKVQVLPGAFSVIPGRTDFSLDLRSTSKETLKKIEESLLALAEDISSTRGLEFASKIMDRTDPIKIPSRITNILMEECKKLEYPFTMFASGAGHDAQILGSIADSGMIFIPCEDGISHSPQEKISWDDLEKGANLLLKSMLRLAN